ncbi:MFS transporter [Bacillus sp. 1P06AnD]|uniref:MFS transporter n=1 Tax=Bacillus sp. 1P06AnD TaxID=3132208 RepID=UPI0039A31CEE
MELTDKNNHVRQEKRVPVSKNYYWVVITLFTLGWVLMYADRTILNPIMGHIADEFNLNKSQLGLINSVFFLAYAIFQIPGGMLGDKFGRKLVIWIGFLIFGVFTGLTGLVSSFAMLMVIRFIVGIGEGTYYGPQYALSTEAIPTKHLTLGTAIINSGQALGISGGYLISSYLVLEAGMDWKVPFYVMTIPTVIMAILFAWFLKEKIIRPEDQNANSSEEAAKAEKVSLGSIFKNRNLLMAFIMCFCSLYGFFVVVTWLPEFLQTERGFEGGSVGFISSLVPWASIPGAIIFARLADKLKRTKVFVFTMVPLAIVCIIAVAFVTDRTILIIALIGYGLFGKLALDPILVAFVAKNAPKGSLGTTLSSYNFIGMSSSILAPYITGAIADTTGSMQTGFYLSAGLLVVGMIFMLFAKEKVTYNN